MKSFLFWSILLLTLRQGYAQVRLDARGQGNTYELITSIFAPKGDAVESPDCVHTTFGRHITEVFDTVLNKSVFEFYSHVAEDNDRCIAFDRQRIEIKTYETSPDNLKGTLGETVTYKWQFKLPVGFQPSSSFTHIHQIKAVGGTEDAPIFTLTPRKGSPNKMELIHDNTTKIAIVNLSLFEGVWVEATETIKIGANGTYSMLIKKVSDNIPLLSYSNNNMMTIRPDNNFIRPKWGIYRSLANASDLRNEAIRFAGFSIVEGTTATAEPRKQAKLQIFPTLAHEQITILDNMNSSYTISSLLGREILRGGIDSNEYSIDIHYLPSGAYLLLIGKRHALFFKQ